MMGRKRKKLPGHFCWCCGRRRPNERFSGRGHRRHICKDCMKLGKEELAYRQHVRNIDRLLTWDGIIRRKQRPTFERYLSHSDARVREYANKVKVHNELRRKELRELNEAERLEEERLERYLEVLEAESDGSKSELGGDAYDESFSPGEVDLDEIPF